MSAARSRKIPRRGIFGSANEHLAEKLGTGTLQVGYKQEIEEGEAFVRSSVSGELKDYRVEILEVHRNEEDVNKGIILEVTDPELLALTGGIVQGMSGSPIIQNGKLSARSPTYLYRIPQKASEFSWKTCSNTLKYKGKCRKLSRPVSKRRSIGN